MIVDRNINKFRIYLCLLCTFALGCVGETTTTDRADLTVPLSQTAMSCVDIIHNYQVMERLEAHLLGGNLLDLPRELMRAGSLLSDLMITMRTDFNPTSKISKSNDLGNEWLNWSDHYGIWSDWSYSCENPPTKLREDANNDVLVRTPKGTYGIEISSGFSEETAEVINNLHDKLDTVYQDTDFLQSMVDEQKNDLGFSPVTLVEFRQAFQILLSSFEDSSSNWKRNMISDSINFDHVSDISGQSLEESEIVIKPDADVATLSTTLSKLYLERAEMYDTLVDIYAILWEESASYRSMGWGPVAEMYTEMADVYTEMAKRDWSSAPSEAHSEHAREWNESTFFASRAESILEHDWGSSPADMYSKLAQQQTKLAQAHIKMAEMTESVGSIPLTDLCVDLESLNEQAKNAVTKARVKDLEWLSEQYPVLSDLCTFQ